jgi:heptosyltransferase I
VSRRPLAGTERHLLLVLLKGVGDVVYGLALAGAIKAAHPDLQITWVVGPAAEPLLRQHPSLRQAIPYAPRAAAFLDLRRQLKGIRFDLVLNLGMYLHALPPVLLSRSERTICFDRGYARDGLPWFHRETIPVVPQSHVMDAFFAAGRYLGLDPGPPAWTWPFTPAEQTLRAEFFAEAGRRPRVALVPCAGRAEKDWPPDRFGELAVRLRERADAFVVVVGGPTTTEAGAASVIAARDGRVRVAVGDDLRRVLWLLSACDLVVAPDTGPLHLARALDVPLLGLYGHTDPRRYGPYLPFRGAVIDRYHFDAAGEPSDLRGSGGRADRMRRIEVAEVEALCLQILSLAATSRGDARQESGVA